MGKHTHFGTHTYTLPCTNLLAEHAHTCVQISFEPSHTHTSTHFAIEQSKKVAVKSNAMDKFLFPHLFQNLQPVAFIERRASSQIRRDITERKERGK